MTGTASANRTKIFDSLIVEFSDSLRLRFEIFDFPLAQRWAALVAAYSNNSARAWVLKKPESHRDFLQNELEFLLQSLRRDEASFQLFRNLEKQEGVFTESALLAIRASDLFRQLESGAGTEQEQYHFRLLKERLKSFAQALEKRRRIRLTNITLEVKYLQGMLNQSLEDADFRHFQDERMPGGIRLQPEGQGLSAVTCANNWDPYSLPYPMRKFGPAFRLDLSPQYPSVENWETHQTLLKWAQERSFQLDDRRQWADCVYVARLCREDLARIEKIAEAFSLSPKTEVLSMQLVAAPRGVIHRDRPGSETIRHDQ